MLPLIRTRLALALIAAAGVALELALMRGLAFRFSSHFAGIVISVGLLGFGAAGSLLTFVRPLVLRHQRSALVILALALAAAIPASWWLSQLIPLNINFLAWNFLTLKASDAPSVLLLELLMLLPLMFTGAFIGVALMDTPTRINGHYASDLLGSGIGGIAAVLAMNLLSTAGLLIAITLAALLAALLLLRWRNPAHLIAATLALALTLLLATLMPRQPAPNPYKPLTLVTLIGNKIIFHADGPLGTIDVADGPSLHGAPQLSLQYLENPPPHVELFVDGDGPTLIFDCKTPADWEFTDYRTAAAPYHLRPTQSPPKVCIIGAGGGVDIGLATFHKSPDITALEFNPQIIHAMTGPLASRGGSIYSAPGVHIVNQEARGFFAATKDSFDIIEFPPVGGFGAAGSDATQESYYYTTESLQLMYQHLSPTGILALTRGISRPPREELRAFDLAAQALRAENLDPAQHLAMIRGNFSCTILLSKQPLSTPQIAALRAFCKQKGFDPCYFPGITFKQANPTFDPKAKTPDYGDFNIVDLPYYFSAPQALLNLQGTRDEFLATYPFDISAPSDNQPYFFHTFRWSAYPALKKEYGEGIHIFLEVSYVMLLVALSQALLLAVILILLPLTPRIRNLRQIAAKPSTWGYFLLLGLIFMLLAPLRAPNLIFDLFRYLPDPTFEVVRALAILLAIILPLMPATKILCQTAEKPTTLAYFLMLGLGFMLLEMGLVQKLVLYLAHPIYSAAVVIASFLVFAGLGSTFCRRWKAPPPRVIALASIAVVAISGAFLLALDGWLNLTQSWPMGPRCLVAALTIAPLAFAMGHFFPLGLKHTADASPALVPWSWAINGFASVVAAAAAPLLAMRLGISSLTLTAIACYTLAALLFHHMSRVQSTLPLATTRSK